MISSTSAMEKTCVTAVLEQNQLIKAYNSLTLHEYLRVIIPLPTSVTIVLKIVFFFSRCGCRICCDDETKMCVLEATALLYNTYLRSKKYEIKSHP